MWLILGSILVAVFSLKPIERIKKKQSSSTIWCLDYKQHDNIVNDNIRGGGGVCNDDNTGHHNKSVF
jgi:hypothetical protein